MTDVVLSVKDLSSGYSGKIVLHELAIRLEKGEIVAIIGHNGSGKSTLLKSIFGLHPKLSGTVDFRCIEGVDPSPGRLVRAGARYLPQGNRVFDRLTVAENLELAHMTSKRKSNREEDIRLVLEQFPSLSEVLQRRPITLSGGQRQLLAVANCFVSRPKLLLLDEPTIGLAPHLAFDLLQRIRKISRNEEISVLVVEHKVRQVLEIADRVYVLRNGRLSFDGPASSLSDTSRIQEVFF